MSSSFFPSGSAAQSLIYFGNTVNAALSLPGSVHDYVFEAERLRYRLRARRLDPPEACAGYADVLRGFIRFMRYGVKSPSVERNLHEGLQAYREAVLENYMESAEYVERSGGKQ